MTTSVSIIEDDRTTRESLAGLIDQTPALRCLNTYADAEAALKSVPLKPPDVLLVDLQLPKLSGIECIRQLKKLRLATKLLVFTRFADNDHIFQALQAGADGYILKRKTASEILQGILDIVQGRPTMSSEVAQRVIAYFHELGKHSHEIERLAAREREVLELLAKGWTDKEIARHLGISPDTVNDHLKRIYSKLHVQSRAAAVAKLLKRSDRGV